MENLTIAKKYSEKKVKVEELYMDTVTLEDGSQKNVQKVREVEKLQSVLDNDQPSAFVKANETAKKLGYAAVSLIAEDENSYTFQLYNKIEQTEEEGDK